MKTAKEKQIQNITLKRLKAIEEISYACASLFTSDLPTATNKVLKPFCELTGADYGVVLLLKYPEKQIYLNATYGLPVEFSNIYNNKLKFKLDSNEFYEKWPSLRSITKKQIVLVKDSNQNVGLSKFFLETIKPNTIKSVVSVPIIINNQAVGAVTNYFIKPHEFDDEELSFVKTTTNIITSTIERNLLVERAVRSERELLKAYEELKQVNQELDSFVYISSHDLREPLRTIESFISIIQEKSKAKLTNEEEDYLQRIIRATHRMRKLIEDLTHLSRASRETHPYEKVDLNKLLVEIQFELTAFILNKNASIHTYENLPPVLGHKEKVTSIFKNLITNGIKFNKSTKPLIRISVEDKFTDSNKVCVCIEDNGIGIKKEYKAKVFGLFQRLHADDEYEGTGAGLAIVNKILEKYNCAIWFESKENIGTKFYFTLPKAQ